MRKSNWRTIMNSPFEQQISQDKIDLLEKRLKKFWKKKEIRIQTSTINNNKQTDFCPTGSFVHKKTISYNMKATNQNKINDNNEILHFVNIHYPSLYIQYFKFNILWTIYLIPYPLSHSIYFLSYILQTLSSIIYSISHILNPVSHYLYLISYISYFTS